MRRTTPLRLSAPPAGLLVLLVACNGSVEDQARARGPSSLVLSLPATFGDLRRAPVLFEHGVHTTALGSRRCDTCHPHIKDGSISIKMGRTADGPDRDRLMNLYHERCIDCHTERTASGQTSGPVTCGECHRTGPMGPSSRLSMHFDGSLHVRHARAFGDEIGCKSCHHVYNEATRRRVHKKGAEATCRSCHKDTATGRTPSLRGAVHQSCVNCHLARRTRGKSTGPTLCAGCHDARQRATIERLRDIPRLMRGQKDRVLMHAPGAKQRGVPFDHQGHEAVTTFCSSCHHGTDLHPCRKCHTPGGAPEGGGVTLEQAFHRATSEYSCVGCHLQVVSKSTACAGCHHVMQQGPVRTGCAVCHRREPSRDDQTPTLAALPPPSEALPETVVIKRLAKVYRGSVLPHRKIVARLDAEVRKSKLARASHGRTEVLCQGCHHGGQVGAQLPSCSVCHGQRGEPIRDRPGLRAAYHRQCIGCHEAMKIKRGCTDCHERAAKERQP